MFDNIMNFFKKFNKKEEKTITNSKDAAKERLHLVLMQDRANVSADFLELMKQEIIEVIKKYIDVDESAIDVRLTNKENGDGTNGAPALYANIPILNIKNEARKVDSKDVEEKKEIESSIDKKETKDVKAVKQEEKKHNKGKEKEEENLSQESQENNEENSEENAEVIIDDSEVNENEEKKENESEEIESNTKDEVKSEN